ncbi:MAG TPA: uracil-DNA glycosylase [Kiritimatiellia bacterium]|nr:uracil-DNA glycosylase [Kiritimatiellia bacterium]HNS81832.1 uracil-DNA glycosylase [Kiritimatiellia bacterium]HPA77206.1 uracil-DNA glycosylase [Kiritimatiellia bacterium]HQQ04600.1 uracil-DNA glycosylase [Kiritimatiellia bacterium]
MSRRQKFIEVLDSTETWLLQEKAEGRKRVEVSNETRKSLGTAPFAAPSSRRPEPPPDRRPAAASAPQVLDPGLAAIEKEIAACTKCPLAPTRTNTVAGQGHPRPEIVFIGEGPGADEDKQGRAFVGRAGQLLTSIIGAMGLTRDEVWIGNIVKCRPPGNRTPFPDEMEACMPFLKRQLAILKPKVIVCLGATAVKGLLGEQTGITKLRGHWRSFEGIDVMPTFHPAYLLRNASGKAPVWEDMKAVLMHLGKPVPDHRKKSQGK